jgi:hypothetical protein
MHHPPKPHTSLGQSLPEYVLPLALVVVVAVGASTLLQDNLFENIMGSQMGETYSAQNKSVHLAPMGTPTAPSAGGLTRKVQIKLADGSLLILNDLPVNIKQSVETVGANGTTELLLANLDSLIRQLRRANQIDETQANRLSNLSNQGHQLAAMQRALEEAVDHAEQTGQSLYGSSLQIGNETVSPYNLATRLGFSGFQENSTQFQQLDPELQNFIRTNTAFQNNSENNYLPGSELTRFYQELYSAHQSGALKDPLTRNIVDALSNQIIALSSTVENAIAYGFNSGKGNITPAEMNALMVSQISNQYAKGICDAGGGTETPSSQLRCSP